jgi:hypothetical protein
VITYVACTAIDVLAPARTVLYTISARVRDGTAPVSGAASPFVDVVHLGTVTGGIRHDPHSQQAGNSQDDGWKAHFEERYILVDEKLESLRTSEMWRNDLE